MAIQGCSDYDKARRLGKSAFFERSTETIRTIPENYCLAYREDGAWRAYRREGATRAHHDAIAIQIAISSAPNEDVLADILAHTIKR